MTKDEPWYGVKALFLNTSSHSYEERVLVYKADTFEQAESRAIQESLDYVQSLENYNFVGIVDIFHIFGDSIGDSTEVFSQIIDSNLSPEAYIDRFYDLKPDKVIHKPNAHE